MNIIGYRIKGIGLDNYGPLETLHSIEKYRFSNVYDINYLCKKFKVPKSFRKYDYISTYDGYDVVSNKFKMFCKNQNYSGLVFLQFPNDSEYNWFKVENIVEFDAKRRGTKFLNFSSEYNGYEEIIGSSPPYLKDNLEIKDDFFRTDLFFADGESKHPLIIIGKVTKLKLETSKLIGLRFEKIEN